MPAARAPRPAKAALDRPSAARLCHALSDETRLAILERLRNGERCVCDLADLLSAGQSRLSFHLKTLRDAGLVVDRRAGRWVHYSLVPGALALLRDYLDSALSSPGPSSPSSSTGPAGKEGTGCCRG